jgi:transposase
MSLHPQDGYQIPEETQRVAHAAFPKGTLCLRIADTLAPVYQDAQFASLFPTRGQPAEAPARLALVTVLPCVEGWSDRRAADAVRARIDWKYALGVTAREHKSSCPRTSQFSAHIV